MTFFILLMLKPLLANNGIQSTISEVTKQPPLSPHQSQLAPLPNTLPLEYESSQSSVESSNSEDGDPFDPNGASGGGGDFTVLGF